MLGASAGGAAAAAAGPARPSPSAPCRISPRRYRPSPRAHAGRNQRLPPRSMPPSLARRRASGEAKTRPPPLAFAAVATAGGAAGAGFAAGASAAFASALGGAGAAAGSGLRGRAPEPPAAASFSALASSPSSRRMAIGALTFTSWVPSGTRILPIRPLVDRLDLHRRLVGLDLGDHVARLDGVALLLEPLGEVADLHGRRQGGHQDVDRHLAVSGKEMLRVLLEPERPVERPKIGERNRNRVERRGAHDVVGTPGADKQPAALGRARRPRGAETAGRAARDGRRPPRHRCAAWRPRSRRSVEPDSTSQIQSGAISDVGSVRRDRRRSRRHPAMSGTTTCGPR